MFTGIVQGTAKLVSIDEKPNFRTHVVELPDHMLDGLETGASVAHNGCCLTVTEINGNHVSFDLMKETLRITNLGDFRSGFCTWLIHGIFSCRQHTFYRIYHCLSLWINFNVDACAEFFLPKSRAFQSFRN